MQKSWYFGKKNMAKHGILAKSRHLMKITAFVISVLP